MGRAALAAGPAAENAKKDQDVVLQSFSPVHHAAAYEVVSEHIRRALHLGRFLPGEKLPAERILAVQLGVSRTVLREAVRVLEGEGLIESRRGASGGILVLAHSWTREERHARLSDHFEQLEQLYEFRIAVEGAAARYAAKRRSESDLKSIEAALMRMEELLDKIQTENDALTVARFTSADSAFHRGISDASGNTFLTNAVEEAWASRFLPIGSIFNSIEPRANNGHRRIFEAIKAGDTAEAEAAMSDHIKETLSQLRGYFENRLVGDEGDGSLMEMPIAAEQGRITKLAGTKSGKFKRPRSTKAATR